MQNIQKYKMFSQIIKNMSSQQTFYNLPRCFCTSNIHNQVICSGTFLRRIMSKGNRRKYLQKDLHPSAPSIDNSFENNIHREIDVNPRRVTVLNKLFMKHITELLSTGEISEQFVVSGLEITSVSIMSNYKMIKVFWYSRKNVSDVEQLLDKSASVLRHELCQLKLMGIVPPIRFFKDGYKYNSEKLLEALDTLNVGTDGEEENCESESAASVEIPEIEEDIYDVKIPEMTHNIFNVNHSYMMHKVIQTMSKAKASERRRAAEMSNSLTDLPKLVTEHAVYTKDDAKMLKDFLKQRKLKQRQIKLEEFNAFIQNDNDPATEFDDDCSFDYHEENYNDHSSKDL